MATATEEQRARDKGGRTRMHTPGFLILVSVRNCVARHGAFREDDNAARVMRMSMQPPMRASTRPDFPVLILCGRRR